MALWQKISKFRNHKNEIILLSYFWGLIPQMGMLIFSLKKVYGKFCNFYEQLVSIGWDCSVSAYKPERNFPLTIILFYQFFGAFGTYLLCLNQAGIDWDIRSGGKFRNG